MSSFIHVESANQHAGVDRAASVLTRIGGLRRIFNSASGLAALLLAAIVASMLVVADRIMSVNDEGGLLMAWVVLWGVAFVGLALFSGSARRLAIHALHSLRDGAERRAREREDAEMLASARHDGRMLSELRAIAAHREITR